MRHSSKGLEIIARFFYDTYLLKNANGNPFLKEGEEIDRGQQLQVEANTVHIAERLSAENVVLAESDYKPIPHDQWEPGEVVVNVRTGSVAVLHERKVAPHDNPFPGWWLLDVNGDLGGGIADFVEEWRSVKCLLAERRHLGLQ